MRVMEAHATTTFQQTIEHLVTVHEGEVAGLQREVERLKDELEVLQKRKPEPHAIGANSWGVDAPRYPDTKLLAKEGDGWQKNQDLPVEVRCTPRSEGALSIEECVLGPGTSPPDAPDVANPGEAVLCEDISRLDSKETHQTQRTHQSQRSSQASFQQSTNNECRPQSWRARLAANISSPQFEAIVGLIVVANTIVMAVELQYTGLKTGHTLDWHSNRGPVEETWPGAQAVFQHIEGGFTLIFALELTAKILLMGRMFFNNFLNYLDLLVVTIGVLDWMAEDMSVMNPTIARLLRLVKLSRGLRVVRLTHAMESLQLLLNAMVASVATLLWSLIMLTVIQCIAGMTLSQLLQPWLRKEEVAPAKRQRVYRYYGTFTYTMITMFEVHLANWSPACRVLVDEVSEWYGLFFIIYRCVAGFAVLNVINAVFIQHTMKVAQSSNDMMILQRHKQQAAYQRRLKQVFKRMDTSGDNVLSSKEIEQISNMPDLKHWFSALELEASDLFSLFKMFDNGDGEITMDEFVQGAIRLKGPAKSIDMALVLCNLNKIEDRIKALEGTVGRTCSIRV